LSGKIFTAYPLNTIAPDKNSIFFYQEDNEEVDEEQMAQDEAILNAGNKVIVLKKAFF
jgi:hypothetical protein